MIAQDVLKVLPSAVKYNNDVLSLNYSGVIGLLVESTKEQQLQIEELTQFEKTVNIDSLVKEIKISKSWSKEILNEKDKLMYAHSLFNHGVLTGENSCFGGRIVYVDSYKKD